MSVTTTPLPSKCKTCKCDIGIILKDYLTPLLKLLQGDPDLKDFDLSDTTKCLNTSVLLMVFMAGKKAGMNAVNQCDTVKVTERHMKGVDANHIILPRYTKQILSPNFKRRQLYYILLTDGWFKYGDSRQPVYFPGHVFILEKVKDPVTYEISYFMYQSYINQYDLNGHYTRMNGDNRMTRTDVNILLQKLSYIVGNGVWDDQCCTYWKDFTKVDTPDFKGTVTKDSIFVCIRSVPLVTCMRNIESYVNARIKYSNDDTQRSTLSKILSNVQKHR